MLVCVDEINARWHVKTKNAWTRLVQKEMGVDVFVASRAKRIAMKINPMTEPGPVCASSARVGGSRASSTRVEARETDIRFETTPTTPRCITEEECLVEIEESGDFFQEDEASS